MAGKEIYKLTNIRMAGNEHGKLKRDVIYAELRFMDGTLAISATLDHILKNIRNENLAVKGVSVTSRMQRGTYCSTVAMELYT